ncbi:MAG TPA: dihydrolipoyl dehydrogenase [Ignavibacteriales bacterium]|nr:dihydrolipoyl dehydrogenase [Ignavibacteriales bacterium]
MKEYDIAILGGGPGGYVAAIRAGQLGFRTAVIDKDNLGGICLNWGCIPTKSLLKNAEYVEKLKEFKDFGINIEKYSLDFGRVIKRSREISDRMTKNVEILIKKNKVDRYKGFGKLKSKTEIEVYDNGNKVIETVKASKIIIATGARPREVPTFKIDRKTIITSKEALILDEVPKEFVIIGAGAIGVEFAYFYNAMGSKVTLIEMLDRILPIEDKEISFGLEKSLKKKGIDIYTSAKVTGITGKNNGAVVKVETKDGPKEFAADKVLTAIGVTGNIEGFGLEELGVQIEKSHIKVDKETYQTNVDTIYAIGDVIGPPWLAHVASAEGIYCVEKLKGLNPHPIDYDAIPGCVYSQPQTASVGLTEDKAKEKGFEVKIGKFPFMGSGKAFAIGERDGFVKLVFDAKYGGLLGAHIIGAEATEMIAEMGIAITHEATYESILKTVHSHPTLSESIMEAAANANGEAIHI